MRRALILAAGIAFAVAMSGPARTDDHESDAHHYRKAIAALKEAEEQLEKVDSNHKDYRSSAQEHVKEALEYAEKGLHHAEKD